MIEVPIRESGNRIGDSPVLMNEGPTVIGMMSAIIEGGGSLDTAVRDISANGPMNSSRLFKKVSDDADTRQSPGIREGFHSMISSLPASLTAFRRAMHMVAAASESADRTERVRMLKDASDISLSGLKEAGETYSSSLNSPCMMIFGLGIMVPMVLMSILPMLGMGGLFSSSLIGSDTITVMTLVIIPCAVAAIILSIRNKNPLIHAVFEIGDARYLLLLLSAVPAVFVSWMVTDDVSDTIVMSSFAVGAVITAFMFTGFREDRARSKCAGSLKDSVFELGNRLISGEGFEHALASSLNVRKDCAALAESMARELEICRGDICSAIRNVVGPVSDHISAVMCDVFRCSERDLRDAGRLAISIGRQLQDQDTVMKGIQNKLKSITDMMTGTAAVFAPLVLGMSITMLGPLSEMAEFVDFGNTSAVLALYLMELCVLISVLTAQLSGRLGIKDVMFRIGAVLPISMAVFFICTSVSI